VYQQSQGVPELLAFLNLATIGPMLEALVLAGGGSTRMGSPKAALLTPDGQPFIVRIVHTLRAAGVHRITIVTGLHHDATVRACASDTTVASAVRWARNPDPSRGQLSSLVTGMDSAVGPDTQGLLVTLVDVPMVSVDTVRRLVDIRSTSSAPIVRPRVGLAHGHPVIFDRATFPLLRATPFDRGARAVVRHYGDAVSNVEVDDRGCLVDVDTPDDYTRLVQS
jgi:molybdenum cofactor cytidylyltransferase